MLQYEIKEIGMIQKYPKVSSSVKVLKCVSAKDYPTFMSGGLA